MSEHQPWMGSLQFDNDLIGFLTRLVRMKDEHAAPLALQTLTRLSEITRRINASFTSEIVTGA